MTSFFRKLSWLMRRRRKEAELEEELRFHLDEEAEQRQAQGLSTKEVAELLGVTETVVKVRLHRAHTRLRTLILAGETAQGGAGA